MTQDDLNELDGAAESVQEGADDGLTRLVAALQRLGKSNLRLADEFGGVHRMVRWMLLIIGLLVVMLVISLWHQRDQHAELVRNAQQQSETAGQLQALLASLQGVRKDVAAIPKVHATGASVGRTPLSFKIEPCLPCRASDPHRDSSGVQLTLDTSLTACPQASAPKDASVD